MYGLESVAAGFFYAGVLLGVIGTMGVARAAVERRRTRSVAVVLLAASIACLGLAIICYIASPRHTLPF